MPKLTLNKKWLNPLYFIINELAKDDNISFILIYGGKSSSKTVSICQFLAKECYVKRTNSIGYRKESSTIPTTLKKSFNLAIDGMYLHPVFEKQDRRYLCSEGSEIVLKGIDDPEKAKGVEGYKYIYLDELNHFSELELEQFNISLRGIKGQKIFASWNPVDEHSWVKKKLVDRYEYVDTEYKLPNPESFVRKSTCGTVVLIKTTYEDNYWIVGSPCGTYGYVDNRIINQYNELKKFNYDSYWVNVLGNWGHKKVDRPFAFAFDEKKHCDREKVKKYNNSQIVELSFDFNKDPITCVASQHYGGVKYFIKEFRLGNSDIYELCDQIMAVYPNALFMVTGDATGRNRTALTKGNLNYYTVIKQKLKLNDSQLKQGNINPSVADTRVLMNSMLQNYPMYFDPDECPFLINDLKFVEVDDNGDILKDRSSENRKADLLDCARYNLFSFHRDYLKKIGLV